jgi:hypothetical protein
MDELSKVKDVSFVDGLYGLFVKCPDLLGCVSHIIERLNSIITNEGIKYAAQRTYSHFVLITQK